MTVFDHKLGSDDCIWLTPEKLLYEFNVRLKTGPIAEGWHTKSRLYTKRRLAWNVDSA